MSGATFKDPATYDGSPICPRCGSGYPCCADRKTDGTHYAHADTCARYAWAEHVWADDICEECS